AVVAVRHAVTVPVASAVAVVRRAVAVVAVAGRVVVVAVALAVVPVGADGNAAAIGDAAREAGNAGGRKQCKEQSHGASPGFTSIGPRAAARTCKPRMEGQEGEGGSGSRRCPTAPLPARARSRVAQPWWARLPGFFLLLVCEPRARLTFWPPPLRLADVPTPLFGTALRLRSASVTILLPMMIFPGGCVCVTLHCRIRGSAR